VIFKKLEMQGFKSFFDRTSVNFQSGINAVVGPNGCGKSNIADAIRWVLGEQSPKRLRGENMEDLIFAGSDARGPLGMAEVTLTVEANGREFPSPYNKYTEVAVTRRLYRSGESDFLINNSTCRLRDIRELFMDTGMNPRAYAIIDQGHIGDIISSRPENRRVLFEEAAGIARYKERKATALRKLESTERNLLRLNDIIREVKRQIRSLKLQATKAEKYNRLRGEIEELELKMLYLQYCVRGEENLSWQKKGEGLDEIREALGREAATAEATLEAGKTALLQSEKEVADAREEYYSHRARVDGVEHQLAAGRARRDEIAASLARNGAEDSRLSDLQEEIAGERSSVEEEILALETSLSAKEGQHREIDAEVARITEAAGAIKAQIDAENLRFLQEVRAEGEIQNRVTQAQTMKDSLAREIDRLRAEIRRTEEEESGLRAREGELKVTLERNRGERAKAKSALAACGARLEKSRAGFKEAEEDLHRVRENHAQASSRLASLTELKTSLSGWPERFRKEFDRILEDRRLSGQVKGLLATFVQAPPEYETALEAVLGDKLKYLLVNSREAALEAVQALRSDSEVRGTLLPVTPESRPAEIPCEGAGVLGRLSDCVTVPEEYKSSIEHLLRGVYLVEDLAAAERLRSLNGAVRTFVTPAGEVVWADGSLTAGPLDSSRELLPLLRRTRETKAAVAESAEKVRSLTDERERLRREVTACEEETKGLSEVVSRTDLEISSLEKDLAHTRQKITAREERRADLNATSEGCLAEQASFEETLVRELALKSEHEGGRQEREREIAALDERFSSLLKEEETCAGRAGALQVELAAGRERLSHLRTRLERLAADRQRNENRLTALAEEIAGLREEEIRVGGRMEELEEQAKELAGSQQDREKRLADLQDRHRQEAGLVEETEENLRRTRLKTEELHQEAAGLQAKRAELQVRLENVRDRIAEIRSCAPEELWDEETRAAVRGEALEEIEENHREQVARIQSMGPVNLAAIGDHEELQERLEFQQKQREDLEKATEDLRQAIRKINTTSRRKFLETFEQINEKFQMVFPLLFTKGHAVLRLTDTEDPLDAGIEVLAQPAGKKLQRLSLLSGGEKALAAIALLLSIFMVKPTPFCLLDEVDAPLDESNTTRYLELLKTSINGSQLVVITHNKQTMARASNLVGVTMAAPGVSSLISVQLAAAGVNN
jgi:chromosome segregation protein